MSTSEMNLLHTHPADSEAYQIDSVAIRLSFICIGLCAIVVRSRDCVAGDTEMVHPSRTAAHARLRNGTVTKRSK